MSLFDNIPCWYATVAVIWASYQGARGVIESRYANRDKNWNWQTKLMVLDIHDFGYRLVCTLAGFAALLVCYRLATAIDVLKEVSAGYVTLLIFSFAVGVIGVGGQLHYFILYRNVSSG